MITSAQRPLGGTEYLQVFEGNIRIIFTAGISTWLMFYKAVVKCHDLWGYLSLGEKALASLTDKISK